MLQQPLCIIGAGVSGLSLAHYLKRSVRALALLDASDRSGGWINSKQGSFLFERGPRSLLYRRGHDSVNLIEELKLSDQVVLPDTAAAKRRFVLLPSTGRVERISWRSPGLVTAATRHLLFARRGAADKDETVHEFLSRRFSSNFADVYGDALTAGVYAGDSRRLSMRACFPSLVEAEQRGVLRSLLTRQPQPGGQSSLHAKLRGARSYTFRSGMATLTDALATSLQSTDSTSGHVTLETGAEVVWLDFSQPARGIRLGVRKRASGTVQELIVPRVFSTVPAPALAAMLTAAPPDLLGATAGNAAADLARRELTAELQAIRYASAYVVSLGYSKSAAADATTASNSELPARLRGFGFLVPGAVRSAVLGVVFDSCAFPAQQQQQQQGETQTRLTVMLGGDRELGFDSIAGPDEALRLALDCVSRHLHITAAPTETDVFVARDAIPQPYVGHTERVQRIAQLAQQLSPAFTVTGAFMHGVSVNDCISASKRIADREATGTQQAVNSYRLRDLLSVHGNAWI